MVSFHTCYWLFPLIFFYRLLFKGSLNPHIFHFLFKRPFWIIVSLTISFYLVETVNYTFDISFFFITVFNISISIINAIELFLSLNEALSLIYSFEVGISSLRGLFCRCILVVYELKLIYIVIFAFWSS